VLGLPDVDASCTENVAKTVETGLTLVSQWRPKSLKLSLVFDDVGAEIGPLVDELRRHGDALSRSSSSLILEAILRWGAGGSGDYGIIAEALSSLQPALLKMPFPAEFSHDAERICREISSASRAIPWVLLSAGCSYQDFTTRLGLASRAGCSGFIAGAAIWKDAVGLAGRLTRRRWLESHVVPRLADLGGHCSSVVERGSAEGVAA